MAVGRATSATTREADHSRLLVYAEMLHLPPIFVVVVAAGTITAVASYPPNKIDLGLFLASLFASQLAISVHNDYCDRRLDATTKPWRALPSGLVSPAQALGLTGLFAALAVVIAAPLGPLVVALGIVGTGSGFAYNAVLKRTLLVWVPFWVALPTLGIASLVVADELTSSALLAYVVGLPLAVAVYLTDTVGDAASDKRAGVRSLTAVLGEGSAMAVAWTSLAAAVVVGAAFFGDARSAPLFAVAATALGLAVAASVVVPRAHWGVMMAGIVCVGAACAIGLSD